MVTLALIRLIQMYGTNLKILEIPWDGGTPWRPSTAKMIKDFLPELPGHRCLISFAGSSLPGDQNLGIARAAQSFALHSQGKPRTRLARTMGCFCDFKLSGRKIYFSIGRSSIEQKIISLRRKARHPPIQTGNRCQHQISFLRLQSVPREPKTQSQLSWMLLESNITGRLTILFTTLPCQELFICLHQERICQPFFCRKQRMATGH